MAMEQAGIAEPPDMPMEATAGVAMLLRSGRRSADCSSATTPSRGGIDGVSRMHIRSGPVEG
jgi:hypothetical protein